MEVSAVELLVLEYEHLKEEQRLRIGTRDNLLYATLGSLAVVIAGAFQIGRPVILLFVPAVCLILGWTYLVNDDRISAIRRHIERSITPTLTELVKPQVQIFTWEQEHRIDRRRRGRKAFQLSVDLLTFVLTPMAALGVTAWLIPAAAGLQWVGGAELVAVVLLSYQFLSRALSRSS